MASAAPPPAAGGGGGGDRRTKRLENEICTRPEQFTSKKGKTGVSVNLLSNYFFLSKQTNWNLNQYRVDISIEDDRTHVKKALLREHESKLGSYLFDGTMLFTCHRLQELKFVSIRKEDNQTIMINIRFVGVVTRGDYHYIQIFNIIMRKCLAKLDLALVGRNFYDPKMEKTVPDHNLKIWPGYDTSIRQHEAGILMCTEISHKIMRMDTVYDILVQSRNQEQGGGRGGYRGGRGGDRGGRGGDRGGRGGFRGGGRGRGGGQGQEQADNFRTIFQRAVMGVVVLTSYNQKTYKVNDVDFDRNPSSTFQKRDGSEISYADYYYTRYRIKIKNMTQPLLLSLTSARDRRAGLGEFVYLIPELCLMTGITDEMRSNKYLMKDLIDNTRVNPGDRIERLLNFYDRLVAQPVIRTDLKNWDMQLDKNLVQVTGRVLPYQTIFFGNNQKLNTTDTAEWNLQKNKKLFLQVSTELKDWTVICTNANQCREFFDHVISNGREMGFKINAPQYYSIQYNNARGFSEAINEILRSHNQQLICCVTSGNQEVYMAIKKSLSVAKAIPSQVILQKSIMSRNSYGIANKVAIQINCKLGGTPWTVDLSQKIQDLMVVGFDVCHEKGQGQDFGAMVSSLDGTFGRYFSAVTGHTRGEELSNCIATHMAHSIDRYARRNNSKKPKFIIIYRDGVGEGQIPFVYEYEVKKVSKELKRIYGDEPVKFAFVVVTKRISTRFFLNKNNPSPGTVVDDVVTDPLKYDFFIVSQSVKQGTVSPTSYNVIMDTTGLPPDRMQQITYKLCHMYYNWNGTVSVPAPCQYAHKLALIVTQALKQAPHREFSEKLHFL